MIELTFSLWLSLCTVNWEVNHNITYQSDYAHYGVVEKWANPVDGRGDCEDYAIAKKIALEKIGIKSYFATCWQVEDFRHRLHAVLLIDTDHGTLVMSNGFDYVTNYDKLKWQWDKRECQDGHWRKIL